MQDLALTKSPSQSEYVSGAIKMFKKSAMVAQNIKNKNLMTEIEKAGSALKSFCILNKIVV